MAAPLALDPDILPREPELCVLKPCPPPLADGRHSSFEISPDGHKLVPLVHILADFRLECTKDLLGQIPAGFSSAKDFAIIDNLRQHLHLVTGLAPNNCHANQSAA